MPEPIGSGNLAFACCLATLLVSRIMLLRAQVWELIMRVYEPKPLYQKK
jgi:hypothetical protein